MASRMSFSSSILFCMPVRFLTLARSLHLLFIRLCFIANTHRWYNPIHFAKAWNPKLSLSVHAVCVAYVFCSIDCSENWAQIHLIWLFMESELRSQTNRVDSWLYRPRIYRQRSILSGFFSQLRWLWLVLSPLIIHTLSLRACILIQRFTAAFSSSIQRLSSCRLYFATFEFIMAFFRWFDFCTDGMYIEGSFHFRQPPRFFNTIMVFLHSSSLSLSWMILYAWVSLLFMWSSLVSLSQFHTLGISVHFILGTLMLIGFFFVKYKYSSRKNYVLSQVRVDAWMCLSTRRSN